MNTSSIADSYGQDHDRLDGLFRQYQNLKRTDLPRARDGFREFKQGLERHIVWEEEILFPIFEAKTGLRGTGPTEVMRLEHTQIKHHLQRIAEKVHNGDPDTELDEQGLLSVLGPHNQKEEGILYPSTDEFLSDAERREVFERMKQTPAATCDCCCGDAEAKQATLVDVRPLPPPQRHRLVFQTWQSLHPGEALVLVNDHDPKPLYYQFAAEHTNRFTWDYVEQGPETWRVRIAKTG